ncbi:hypothetical protein KC322_g43 [Hortaea werneckii]|nr:hypothetical protein KC322_g43 [Hortaea werneckii]
MGTARRLLCPVVRVRKIRSPVMMHVLVPWSSARSGQQGVAFDVHRTFDDGVFLHALVLCAANLGRGREANILCDTAKYRYFLIVLCLPTDLIRPLLGKLVDEGVIVLLVLLSPLFLDIIPILSKLIENILPKFADCLKVLAVQLTPLTQSALSNRLHPVEVIRVSFANLLLTPACLRARARRSGQSVIFIQRMSVSPLLLLLFCLGCGLFVRLLFRFGNILLLYYLLLCPIFGLPASRFALPTFWSFCCGWSRCIGLFSGSRLFDRLFWRIRLLAIGIRIYAVRLHFLMLAHFWASFARRLAQIRRGTCQRAVGARRLWNAGRRLAQCQTLTELARSLSNGIHVLLRLLWCLVESFSLCF